MDKKLSSCQCEVTITEDGMIGHVHLCSDHGSGLDYAARNEIRSIIQAVRNQYKHEWPKNIAFATTDPFVGDDGEVWRLHVCPIGPLWSVFKEIKHGDSWDAVGWWTPKDNIAEWGSPEKAIKVASEDYRDFELKWTRN